MLNNYRPYIIGAAVMFLLMTGLYLFLIVPKESNIQSPPESLQSTIPSNTISITPLPSLRILRGDSVSFEGKTELKQALAGSFAQDISVVDFQATGENANKSYIKIVWENGEIEKLPPGTTNKQFSPNRRAAEITVIGYSVHERRLFKDSNRKGTLTWEIRYEPAEK